MGLETIISGAAGADELHFPYSAEVAKRRRA
jgi:hypothetical protein